MRFVTLVFRNLFRRTTRTVLSIIAAGVAIGTVVALVGTVKKFEADFAKTYDNWGIDLVIVRAGGAAGGIESQLPQDVQQDIEKIPHVLEVTPGLVDLISFPEKQLYTVPLDGRVPGSVTLNKMTITETVPPGRELKPDDARCILLGSILASQLRKNVGDTVPIFEEEFTVVGVFESTSPLENGGAVVLLSELQRVMGREGKVTGFLVSVETPDPAVDPTATKGDYVDQVQTAVAQSLIDRKGRPIKMKAISTREKVLNAPQMMLANSLVLLISIISLILGSTGMVNTMLTSVFERTREIGILRALGWRQSRILMMILMESWFIGLAGALVGVVGAYLVVWLLGFLPTIRNISTGLPGFVWVQSVLVALVLGFVGGIYPAFRALRRLTPIDAVRHE